MRKNREEPGRPQGDEAAPDDLGRDLCHIAPEPNKSTCWQLEVDNRSTPLLESRRRPL